jgi:O-antigen ligase
MSYQLRLYDLTIEWGLICILVFTPLARGTIEVWSISVVYFITLLMLTAWLLKMKSLRQFTIKRTPLDYPILALLALAAISTLFSTDLGESIAAWPKIITYVLLFYLVVNNINTTERIRRIAITIICVGAFLSIFGLIKYLNGIDGGKAFISATYAGYAGSHNHFAGYLEMAIPVAIGMSYIMTETGKRIMLGYAIMLMVVGVILSLSRGGCAAVAISLSVMGVLLSRTDYFTRKVWLAVIFLPVVFVTLAMIGTNPLTKRVLETRKQMEDLTNDCRIKIWRGTIDTIKDHPLSGTGVGTFATVFPRYQPPDFRLRDVYAHNDYLHITSETGIFVLPFILWLISNTLRTGLSAFLHTKSRFKQGVTLGAVAGIIAILIHSFVDFNLHIPANALLFVVLAAIIQVQGLMPQRLKVRDL